MLTTIEVKSDIHKLVDNMNDIDILYAIKILLSKQTATSIETESDFWDELPESVKQELDISIQQADNGEVYSHQDVIQRMRARYKKDGN